MFFTWLGRILAFGLLLRGLLLAALGLYVAYNFVDQAAYEAASARYLGTKSSGQSIDQGLEYIGWGIVVGLLTTISGALAKKST
ncbi:MAG: hypothetical protein ABJ059_16485 [Hyphomicrobiales bacterium]